jgi:hypothetical protein
MSVSVYVFCLSHVVVLAVSRQDDPTCAIAARQGEATYDVAQQRAVCLCLSWPSVGTTARPTQSPQAKPSAGDFTRFSLMCVSVCVCVPDACL